MYGQVRKSFLAVLFLCFVVAISACSKKDVVMDEPVMNPSDMSGAATTDSGTVDSMATTSAGDVGVAASEMVVVYFDYDSYNLMGSTRDGLKKNADWLKANPSARVQIEGHCDERGTNEYNMALGDRRANAVRTYLSKMGVETGRMETISYGEERSADMGHDESAWSKNRRAVFVVLSR